MRILIAEDDPLNRQLLTTSLIRWDYEVTVCEDGAQAWEELQKPTAPSLLILDWMMPEMDGLQLCRQVRQGPAAGLTYIILLTARTRKDDIVTGLQAGADDYVVKPFDRTELHARIQVGVRVVELWERLVEVERLRVLVQTAGSAAHEINQPLSIILGLSQLLMRDGNLEEEQLEKLNTIGGEVQRISAIVQRMGSVRQYATRSYVEGTEIVDFTAAADGED